MAVAQGVGQADDEVDRLDLVEGAGGLACTARCAEGVVEEGVLGHGVSWGSGWVWGGGGPVSGRR